jgi:hypothetical protein
MPNIFPKILVTSLIFRSFVSQQSAFTPSNIMVNFAGTMSLHLHLNDFHPRTMYTFNSAEFNSLSTQFVMSMHGKFSGLFLYADHASILPISFAYLAFKHFRAAIKLSLSAFYCMSIVKTYPSVAMLTRVLVSALNVIQGKSLVIAGVLGGLCLMWFGKYWRRPAGLRWQNLSYISPRTPSSNSFVP